MVTYPVEISISLSPVLHTEAPEYRIVAENQVLHGYLESTTVFDLSIIAAKKSKITVEFLNKKVSDTVLSQGLDKAVIIDWIKFFSIQDPKFVWLGQYCPEYPEPWASEQKNAGVDLAPALFNTTYLGWNGVWTLEFDVPIFTWIHQVQNHGWLYD